MKKSSQNSSIAILPYDETHGPEVVQVWRESFAQALGDPKCLIHSFENQLAFLNRVLVPQYEVWVVRDTAENKTVGLMVNNQEEINQLYLAREYQGRGIGRELVDRAKKSSSGMLRLYTFEVNQGAQRFYENLGFQVIRRGSENELNMDDILYEWKR